jgi:hypothetical protein
MSSYSAFVALRQYLLKNPELDIATAIEAVKQTNADASNLDYIGGVTIHGLLQGDQEWTDTSASLRLFVFKILRITQPWWLRLVPYGREKVRLALERDQVQCLREAGLFEPVPDSEVIAWWDRIGALVRGTIDSERMLRAREVEKLSLQYERQRMSKLGITLEPQWVSLEDNTLGYDILSYDLQGGRIVSRLIEVKSTTASAIFITRNEWNNAASAENSFYFHVWKLPEKHIAEYRVAQMRPNIPIDQGTGYWEDVRVELW